MTKSSIPLWELLGESYTGGPLGGLTVTNTYDSDLRRTTLEALNGATPMLTTTYGYDNASRLLTVNDGNNNVATYSYLANSPHVGNIVFTHSGSTRMTTTKQYDYLNRLTEISSAPSSAGILPATFAYTYNTANQRTHDTLADGSYWVYGYDSLGQVTNGCKFFADGTPVAGQQFDYTFDTIGNRTQTQTGGDTNGANLRVANYYANSLNQITNRDIPPYVDIMGASILTNTVTVNGQTAYRNQEYFRTQIPANNATTALWTNIIVSGGQSVTGNVYVAQEPESFQYDADGNLTNDGRWAYTWDAENRLIGMMVNTNVGPQYQLTFAYDSKGRRIEKIVTTNGVTFTTNTFLYDNWNLIAVLSQISNLQSTFMWGTDLSGSLQGAGGVGGLLAISYHGTSTTNAFAAYDGNGNVSALVNAADGTELANYDYGPFGETIRINGPMAKDNPFRFSTKYQDDESDLLYYGFRFYKGSIGTWINRDPIGEDGGDNLYGFSNNDSINQVDVVGLEDLLYTSDGEFFHDNNPLHSHSDGQKSGLQKSTAASFSQSLVQTSPGCTGGICNSGVGSGNVSSFVTASVHNTGECPAYLSCNCTVSWWAASTVYSENKRGGFSVNGNVLSKPFSHKGFPVSGSDGKSPGNVWVSSGAGTEENALGFFLGRGQSRTLYYGEIEIAQPPATPGSGFSDGMTGNCSCSAQ